MGNPLAQCFSNSNVRLEPLRVLLKCRFPFCRSGGEPWICFPTGFQVTLRHESKELRKLLASGFQKLRQLNRLAERLQPGADGHQGGQPRVPGALGNGQDWRWPSPPGPLLPWHVAGDSGWTPDLSSPEIISRPHSYFSSRLKKAAKPGAN